MRYAGRFRFRKTANYNQELIYTMRGDSIQCISPFFDTEMKWGLFGRVTESRHGFALFHRGNQMFNWLPKSGFSDSGEVDRCRLLLREKIKDSKRLIG